MRELENLVGYFCMMADGELIEVEHLPDRVKNAARTELSSSTPLVSLEVMQRLHARRVLTAVKGQQGKKPREFLVSAAPLSTASLLTKTSRLTPSDTLANSGAQ